MADYLIQDSTLDAIADAINAKTGGSSAMTPAQMVTEIGSIQTGGGGGFGLLASGTYTLVNGSNSVTIPHQAVGTPLLAFVSIDEPISEVYQAAYWVLGNVSVLPANVQSHFIKMGNVRIISNQGVEGAIAVPGNDYAWGLDNTNIIIAGTNSSVFCRANTYNWYVWGVTT